MASKATLDGQLIATWYMRHGATFIKDYTWTVGGVPAVPASPGVPEVPAIPGTPVDLTGWVARCQFRETVESETILLELTDTAGITLDNLGNINIVVSATQTKALTPYTKIVADLELERTSDGFVRNLVGATVILGTNVTREV